MKTEYQIKKKIKELNHNEFCYRTRGKDNDDFYNHAIADIIQKQKKILYWVLRKK